MLKDFAWNTFEMTGCIDFYMFYREIEENIKSMDERKIAEEEAATSN